MLLSVECDDESSMPITMPVNGDKTNGPGETFFVNRGNISPDATLVDLQGAGTILVINVAVTG